jgi:hypothetical protein
VNKAGEPGEWREHMGTKATAGPKPEELTGTEAFLRAVEDEPHREAELRKIYGVEPEGDE